MELKINEYQLPESITFNFDELKTELEAKIKMYENLVYTDEQIKQAKADKASMNKLKKLLNDERIRREKEYMVPFNSFKQQVNEIIAIIDKPVAAIDAQIKGFEEKQKQEKKERISELFASLGFQNFVTLEMIWDDRWLNSSFTMKSIEDVMKERMYQIGHDVLTLESLPEFGYEAKEIYKNTLNINQAISEAQRMAQIKKAAEEEKKQAAQPIMNPPVVEQEQEIKRMWISFAANLSADDAVALKGFFESRKIEFKKI